MTFEYYRASIRHLVCTHVLVCARACVCQILIRRKYLWTNMYVYVCFCESKQVNIEI